MDSLLHVDPEAPSHTHIDLPCRFTGGLAMTSDGLRLLQDLRRSLLEPPHQLRPRTAATRDENHPGNVSTVA